MKKIRIDVGMCTGCGQCALTCSFKNAGAFDLAQSEIRVMQWEDICLSVPLVCQQCADAPCIEACPSEAIQFHPQTGAIYIDYDLCSQCQACVVECRYQVIRVADSGYPATCDLCGGDPRCVAACYPLALSFVEIPLEEQEPFKGVARTLIDRGRGKNVAPPAELAALRVHAREEP